MALFLPLALLLAFDGASDARLSAGDAGVGDALGAAAAAAPGLAVLGAPQVPGQPLPGRALVFREEAGGWVQEQVLAASDATPEDGFGTALATDGARIVVGAPFPAVAAGPPGGVYVFERVGGVWNETAKLEPPNGAAGDRFGSAVALAEDRVAVGAPQRDIVSLFDVGEVYVYVLGDGGWELEANRYASDPAPFDRFGQALSFDGPFLGVGAPGNDDQGGLAGAAYVLELVGASWLERQKLYAADATPLDRFGESLAMDAGRLAIGAPSWQDRGAVYVFRDDGGGYVQEDQVVPVDTQYVGYFGVSVALEHRVLAVGAPYHDVAASNTGAAYVFHRAAATWFEVERIDAADAATEDLYGYASAISGWTLVAGAPGVDDPERECGVGYAARIRLPIEGASYCAGDGGGTACPCGNEGVGGRGCANSVGPGARLELLGSPSVAVDSLRGAAGGLPPGQPALLFAGTNAVNGGDGVPFGDGLRCAGGAVRRLGVDAADARGRAQWGPGIASGGGFAPGELARFQCWYRDPSGSPCGAGFNLSQGVELVFGA